MILGEIPNMVLLFADIVCIALICKLLFHAKILKTYELYALLFDNYAPLDKLSVFSHCLSVQKQYLCTYKD